MADVINSSSKFGSGGFGNFDDIFSAYHISLPRDLRVQECRALSRFTFKLFTLHYAVIKFISPKSLHREIVPFKKTTLKNFEPLSQTKNYHQGVYSVSKRTCSTFLKNFILFNLKILVCRFFHGNKQ